MVSIFTSFTLSQSIESQILIAVTKSFLATSFLICSAFNLYSYLSIFYTMRSVLLFFASGYYSSTKEYCPRTFHKEWALHFSFHSYFFYLTTLFYLVTHVIKLLHQCIPNLHPLAHRLQYDLLLFQ